MLLTHSCHLVEYLREKFETMNTLKQVNSVLLSTDIDHLWDILTIPEWTEKYMFNSQIISDLTVGSSCDWKGSYDGQEFTLIGTVLEVEPKSLFKYTIVDPNLFDANDPNNYVHVTYEIREQGEGLLLTVVSEIFDGNEARMKEIVDGWKGMIFPAIEGLL